MSNNIGNNYNVTNNFIIAPGGGVSQGSDFAVQAQQGMEQVMGTGMQLVGAMAGLLGGVLGSCGGGCGGI